MTRALRRTTVVPEWTQGDRVGKALQVAGVSVGDMADYLGVNRNTLGGWINDRHQAPVSALRLIALRCKVPFEWLRTGECAVRDSNPEPAGLAPVLAFGVAA